MNFHSHHSTITSSGAPWSHQTISFIKSLIRIFGYVLLPISITAGAIVLVVSEFIGIAEEIGQP